MCPFGIGSYEREGRVRNTERESLSLREGDRIAEMMLNQQKGKERKKKF